jgi:ADP-ribose pyrophosphatase YjhB (NUDIX family)
MSTRTALPPTEFPAGRQRYQEIRHCPRCGVPYRSGDFQADACVFVCAACNFDFYQNPLPAAVAVLPHPGHANSVLFLKRRTPPNIGRWCVPGGFISYGESPRSAAAREILEEVGLEAEVGALLHAGLVDYTYRGRQLCVLEIAFLARFKGPVPPAWMATPEASEVVFLQVDEVLRAPEALASPEQASLLRAYREYLQVL